MRVGPADFIFTAPELGAETGVGGVTGVDCVAKVGDVAGGLAAAGGVAGGLAAAAGGVAGGVVTAGMEGGVGDSGVMLYLLKKEPLFLNLLLFRSSVSNFFFMSENQGLAL